MSRILLIDFDGVIHSYSSGWKGVDVIPDPPVNGAFEWLSDLTRQWVKAVENGEGKWAIQPMIYSSRSKSGQGIEAMKRWLHAWGMPWFLINAIEFPKEKPAAFWTLDDRCTKFDGVFPALEEIKQYKPWNK